VREVVLWVVAAATLATTGWYALLRVRQAPGNYWIRASLVVLLALSLGVISATTNGPVADLVEISSYVVVPMAAIFVLLR
jgi:hypothetical protein